MLRTELHCQSNSIDKHWQIVFAAVRHPFLPPEGVCLWELLLHHWVLNYGSIHFKVSLFVNMNLLTEWKVRLIVFLPCQVERDLMVNIRTKIMTGTKKIFLWELEEVNVKFHKMTPYTWNFQYFSCVFTILVKFDIYFLGLLWEIVFSVITDN